MFVTQEVSIVMGSLDRVSWVLIEGKDMHNYTNRTIESFNYGKNLEKALLALSVTPNKNYLEKLAASDRKCEILFSSNFDKCRSR